MFEYTNSSREKRRIVTWSVLVVLSAVLLTGIYFYQDSEFFSAQETRFEEIVEQPQIFVGREIDSRGDIIEVIGTRGIIAQSTESEHNKILILSRQPLIPVGAVGSDQKLYEGGEQIVVTGTVKKFNLAEIEDELGVDLDKDYYAQWEGRTVIIADSIREEEL